MRENFFSPLLLSKEGYYISPAVFQVEGIKSSLMQEEIFGPVLALYKADHLDQALEYANATSFGLTAGFYSRHPGHIEKFKSLMEVGNVYINRNCTGALGKKTPLWRKKNVRSREQSGRAGILKAVSYSKSDNRKYNEKRFFP